MISRNTLYGACFSVNSPDVLRELLPVLCEGFCVLEGTILISKIEVF